MDANGQQFWLIRGGTPWIADDPRTVVASDPILRLAGVAPAPTWTEAVNEAEARLQRTPQVRDAFGSRAAWDPVTQTVRAFSSLPGTASLALPAPLPDVTDLALGSEGWLYVVTDGAVLVHDLRGRLPDVTVRRPGFVAGRLVTDPTGGAWVLDRINGQLAHLTGQLWPTPRAQSPSAGVFTPLEENPHPLQLVPFPAKPWRSGEAPVALACTPAGQLLVLLWLTGTGPNGTDQAAVRHIAGGEPSPGQTTWLEGVVRPFSLACLGEDRLAVLAAGVPEALVYARVAGPAAMEGDYHPLPDHDGGPFLQGGSASVEFPTVTGSRPLIPIAQAAFRAQAGAHLRSAIDCGVAGLVWHRLYVEAELPAGTGFTLWLKASDDPPEAGPAVPVGPDTDWHPHHFGVAPVPRPGSAWHQEPEAAWVPGRSEIPGFDGFLTSAPERHRAGLFTVLIQRAERRVRTLRGRFLQLRIELRGSGRATPCLHALRAYGPRFSYLDRYLPALYREQLFGPAADAPLKLGEPTTRADFLGRWLANFEGLLTSMEDQVADAWLWTDPRRTPDETVAWLGSWIGVAFEPWYPVERRRDHLRHAPELFRRRGTLEGLRLALDVVTAGGVRGDADGRRRIVVVEDYWMRRTLATVLGVNLDRELDPLLGGPVVTGNSKVGRTLLLNDGTKRELLALFEIQGPLSTTDAEAVDAFFTTLAHRATVLVHQTVNPQELGLIERVVAQESPAHASVRVRRASHQFMAGMAALLGVDTFLLPTPEPEGVTVESTPVGEGALLQRPPSLDPRIQGVFR